MLHQFSLWVMRADILGVICMAQVACLCAIYGGVLSTLIRKKLKPYGFLVRVTGFVLMHAFVFGFIGALLATVATHLYHLLPHPWHPLVMLCVFLIIGLVAEEHKEI